MAIEIIGWGDTPTRQGFAVCNDQVLETIRANLRQRLDHKEGSDEELAHHRTELEKLEARTAREIEEKIGVATRQYATDKTSTPLAIEAAEQAIERARKYDPAFDVSKIKLVLSGGSTPDDIYPACAGKIQDHFRLTDAEGFDVSLACCSGTQALITAARAMKSDGITYALVATGETVGSPRCNELIDEHATLWGDGGGAVVLRYLPTKIDRGLIAYKSKIDGSLAYTTRSRGIGAHIDHRSFRLNPSMEGHARKIQTWVRGDVKRALVGFTEHHELDIANNPRAFAFFHNGNRKMIENEAEDIGIPAERVMHRIVNRGNQSSASVFSSLAFHVERNGALRANDLLLFATFGGGVAYNFLAYRW